MGMSPLVVSCAMDSKLETVRLLRKLSKAFENEELLLLAILVESSPRPISRKQLIGLSGLRERPHVFVDALGKLCKAGLVGKLRVGREDYLYPEL